MTSVTQPQLMLMVLVKQAHSHSTTLYFRTLRTFQIPKHVTQQDNGSTTDTEKSVFSRVLNSLQKTKRMKTCTENTGEKKKTPSGCSQMEQHPYHELNEAGVLWKQVIM